MFKRDVLETREELTATTKCLHKDMYNEEAQEKVSWFKNKLRDLEDLSAEGVAIRSRVQWKHTWDKCTKQFFQRV